MSEPAAPSSPVADPAAVPAVVPAAVPPAAPVAAPAFRVLVVCTGNVCRSPAVERLLAAALPEGSGVEVASAGTGALAGAAMAAPMAALVREAGADPDGFVARQLRPEHLRGAGLVLVATRRHRSAVVEVLPAAVRRTFTLREIGRLLEATDVDALLAEAPAGTGRRGPAARLAALVPLLAARRGLAPAADPAEDDVVDPWNGPASLYRESFDALVPGVRALAAAARG
ncbi:low molecular weight phosphatase family protein [Cellulomonas endophytica]|uniref:arsenate reductase/protein-tyrosine-phosphatase family protein n=1 Tax=Cellulomonas endophytica TaxID=2494735 RepID=UPI0023EA66AF|nr:low molecular weight phosphatase family protein [Cellulomonas endophytica]